MKSFLTFLSVFLLFSIYYLLSAVGTHAQAITFPIEELGNCNNAATCKVYCDQLQNHDACTSFAKEKGISAGKRRVSEKHVVVLSAAKTALGCSTIAACQAFCEEQANWKRCQAFAQKHELSVAPSVSPVPTDDEFLNLAKDELGCTSQESCFAFCEQTQNFERCAALAERQITSEERAFFDQHRSDFQRGLGCDSLQSCMAFCMNPLNMPKCMDFGNQMGFTSSNAPAQEPPEVWCSKISSECSWNGTDCVCNGPETCQKSPGCSWNGQYCNCGDTPTGSESPEIWCPKAGPGCSWDGKECFCPGSSSSTQTDFTQPAQEPGEVWCPKIGPYCVWDGTNCTCWDDCVKGGGAWTGSKCDYPQPTPEPGKVWCPRNPGCNWTGTECQCTSVEAPQTVEQSPTPAVQGANVKRGLLQQILDFILRI